MHKCIASENTYPKFAPTQPNLLVIADDLHVNLQDSLDHVEIALYADHTGYGEKGYFTSARFENIGGLAVFRGACFFGNPGVLYEFTLFENPFALPATKLPDSLLGFKTTARGRFAELPLSEVQQAVRCLRSVWGVGRAALTRGRPRQDRRR